MTLTINIHGANSRAGEREQHAMRDDVVLRVSGLTKRYGARVVVHDLDLVVGRGEVFGLLGPNGAGKTTVISMILGLVKPDSGHVEILGGEIELGRVEPLRRVGAIVEGPAFYPYLSGLDNLRAFALARGGVAPHRFGEVLALLGLAGRERARVSTYSLGMRQRLGIAAALLHEPDLLILDEPSNGLDPAGIVEIRHLLRRLAASGKSVVLSSHLLHEVEQVCDRVAILVDGELRLQGTVESLHWQGVVTVLRVEDPRQVEVILRETPGVVDVRRKDDTLLVRTTGIDDFAIGRVLAEHRVVISELRRKERDLEDVFLDITGHAGAER